MIISLQVMMNVHHDRTVQQLITIKIKDILDSRVLKFLSDTVMKVR